MDNLITETNARLNEIISNLTTIKEEYENKLEINGKDIDNELTQVKKYKEEFLISKQKIEKMNSDIEGFEEDYKKLVERFKDDELANILIAANKEISAKIDERRKKIAKDKVGMNELVELAENSKNKLVKLTAEKKALELCLARILDSYEYYTKSLSPIISYSEDHRDDLCSCFYEENSITPLEGDKSEINFDNNNDDAEDVLYETEDAIDFDADDNTEVSESELEEIGLDLDSNIEDEFESEEINDESELYQDNDDDVIEEEEINNSEDIEDDEFDDEEFEDDEFDENDDEEEVNIENEENKEEQQEDETVEENKEEVELDDIPSSIYDLDDSLDLESLLEFED